MRSNSCRFKCWSSWLQRKSQGRVAANISLQMLISRCILLIQNHGQVLIYVAVGSVVSEQEHISIILVGLSVEYESVREVALTTNVSLDLLIGMLVDCGARQLEFGSNIPVQANMVYQQKNDVESQSKNSSSNAGYVGSEALSVVYFVCKLVIFK
ncbi:uncharacterized protein [Gossypium hirsutum]|uniref:Uncharacterized protein isoform X1 n=1 Tax=Gossypium hirsutum TaxID=3635 RepID=A0ABM2ZK35_GOSHI|nr:uncharacterized protein LOC121213851 isoform X1 [Gossypium hirsutum]